MADQMGSNAGRMAFRISALLFGLGSIASIAAASCSDQPRPHLYRALFAFGLAAWSWFMSRKRRPQ